jgi:hypothetical protein
MQCPDCDFVRPFCDPPKGNGKCSACRGTGFGRFFDAIALELLNVEHPRAKSATVPANARRAEEPA